MRAFPNATYRHIVASDKPLPGGIVPLDFSNSTLIDEWQLGISAAKAALKV